MTPDKHGVVAILQDAAGRYLVIRRGLELERAPGWWCFPGGEVEASEGLEQAIEREVMEELNLRVKARAKVHESISPNGVYRLHWFRVELMGDVGELKAHATEVAEACWLSVEEILAKEQVLPGLVAWLKDQGSGVRGQESGGRP
ncbi:MAG TPA: NUDIX hydrolase [Planctomycetota bacterium]|nr:NUDIX hydrolase [Planctomycetota bacterium]